jgi:hypothetical protein
MKSRTITIILVLAVGLALWSCEDIAPTASGPGSVVANLSGTITDLSTSLAVPNASIFLVLPDRTDSTVSSSSGQYEFAINLDQSPEQSATLIVNKRGYLSRTIALTVTGDTVVDVGIRVDLSTSSLITGTVRDSTTLYPLRNAKVLLTLPGYADSASTSNDGAFSLTADLIDRDSLPVSLTIFKAGFKTKHIGTTLYKGQTKNLGDILMEMDVASTVAQVYGRVFDSQSRLPLNNATVIILTNIFADSAQTSFSGEFSFSIDLKGLASVSGILNFAKAGYKPQSWSFSVNAGSAISNDFFLVRDTTTSIRDSSGTGLAHSIAFVNMTNREISVAGVGGTEATILSWEVRDSLGFPIDIDHRDSVMFELQGTPVAGGAYVSPSWAMTNASGRVATTVNSGTVSGVLQFVASLRREEDGVVIRSTPVIITVNAGLPDQAHFSIGPEQFNFAGYDWIGHTDIITVQVGDKYSNPVKTGTAVYFNTTGGVIAASGFTDATSHASVTLYSGNPLPMFFPRDMVKYPPELFGDSGKGYTWVRSYSMGENSVEVTDSTLVLMSGISDISIDTAGVDLSMDSGTCVTLPVRISDRFGNPLAPSTTVSTELQFSPPEGTNWSVLAYGLPEDPFADYLTRGPGHTDFSLTICDGTPGGTPERMPFTVTIKVKGPNGNVNYSFSGSVGP